VLQDLLCLAAGRGAHVEHPVARLHPQQLRRHHRHLLLPAHVAEIHLRSEKLVEGSQPGFGGEIRLGRGRGLLPLGAAASALPTQNGAGDVEAPRQPRGQPGDRGRSGHSADAGDGQLRHPGDVLGLHKIAERKSGGVVGVARDAKRDAERGAKHGDEGVPLALWHNA